MIIKWFGHSCFLITAENGMKILTDPYKNMLGYKLSPEIEADIVLTSHNHMDHNYISAVKDGFIHICEVGRFSEKVVEITGVETFHDKEAGAKKGKNIIYNFKIDGINVCHCGDLGHVLNCDQVEQIGNVDVLMVPVGGGYTIDGSDVVKVVGQLKPSVIIPMHYRTKALGVIGFKFNKVDKFISASGLSAKVYGKLELNEGNIKDYSGIAVLKYD